MTSIPKIFPLTLLVIIVSMFFLGAYAIAEDALGEVPVVKTASAYTSKSPKDDNHPFSAPQVDWYEQAAIWVCPLH